MLSRGTKAFISNEVQKILQSVSDSELPKGEISFILHIDGAEDWTWANIRNESACDIEVPDALVNNLTYVK